MKKKIFSSIAVFAIVAIAVFNVNFGAKNSKLSYVSLANVEALAETDNGNTTSHTAATRSTKSYTKTREQNGKTLNCYVTEVNCSGTGTVMCTESYDEKCS